MTLKTVSELPVMRYSRSLPTVSIIFECVNYTVMLRASLIHRQYSSKNTNVWQAMFLFKVGFFHTVYKYKFCDLCSSQSFNFKHTVQCCIYCTQDVLLRAKMTTSLHLSGCLPLLLKMLRESKKFHLWVYI